MSNRATLRLSVHNFGPLAEGMCELGSLTIVVGRNNVGKSTLAELLYAASDLAVQPFRHVPVAVQARFTQQTMFRRRLSRLFGESTDELLTALASLIESDVLEIEALAPLESFVLTAAENFIRAQLQSFDAETRRIFERDWVRHGTRKSWMRLEHVAAVGWSAELKVTSRGLSVREITLPSWHELQAGLQDSLAPLWSSDAREHFTQVGLARELLSSVTRLCFEGFPIERYYLPAARSGIMQAQRLLAGLLINRSSMAGVREMSLPRLPGVASDFLEVLFGFDEGYLADAEGVADSLEAQVLGGSIEVVFGAAGAQDFLFTHDGNEVPLSRTSSMVSELAPLVVVLRYMLDSGEMLVLEEPEAHLHPAAQLALAKAIGQLVQMGVRIFVTTHSDLFLQQLNSMMMTADVKASASRNVIDPNQVRAYEVVGGPRGSRIRDLNVAERRSVNDDTFLQVAEELYDETTSTQRALVAQGGQS